MARALLVSNPRAARTDQRSLKASREAFVRAGWEVEVGIISGEGEAEALARRGVAEDFDVIAVHGGDGTTMQAVKGMVGREVPLGLIPGGTGNLLAGNLRLPRSPEKAVQTIVSGSPRRIDLGRMMGSDGVHHFAVACGAGYDAKLMAGTSGEAKRRWGMGAYVGQVWNTLHEVKNTPFHITVDGENLEIEAAMILVANCGEIIPRLVSLSDRIVPDDGVFDLVAMKANGIAESVGVVWELLTRQAPSSSRFEYARGSLVEVQTPEPVEAQLDGEPGGVTPFTAEVIPQGLLVMVG